MAVCAEWEDMWTGCRVRVVVRRGFPENALLRQKVLSKITEISTRLAASSSEGLLFEVFFIQ
jgi:hypothetical protein|tara:strand:+ start:98 stop:283 length:186 start_codon:yes stop_codon:yes gene_type:complete